MKIKKKRIFYVKFVHTIQRSACFRPFMHVIVAPIRVLISKTCIKFPYFCMLLCIFAFSLSFSSFLALFCPFLKKSQSSLLALEYVLQCYYYLDICLNYILHNVHITCINKFIVYKIIF